MVCDSEYLLERKKKTSATHERPEFNNFKVQYYYYYYYYFNPIVNSIRIGVKNMGSVAFKGVVVCATFGLNI